MLGCPHYSIEQIWEASPSCWKARKFIAVAACGFSLPAIRQNRCRRQRLHQDHPGRGRARHDRHLSPLQSQPHDAGRDQGGNPRFCKTCLTTWPAIMGIEAWFGTTQDCVDAAITGPLERRAAMSQKHHSARAQSRGRLRHRRSVGHSRDHIRLGRHRPYDGHDRRNASRTARPELQGQGAGVSRRKGIVRMVQRVSHGSPRECRAQGDGLQRHDHQDRPFGYQS